MTMNRYHFDLVNSNKAVHVLGGCRDIDSVGTFYLTNQSWETCLPEMTSGRTIVIWQQLQFPARFSSLGGWEVFSLDIRNARFEDWKMERIAIHEVIWSLRMQGCGGWRFCVLDRWSCRWKDGSSVRGDF